MEQQEIKQPRHRTLVELACPVCLGKFYGTGRQVYCSKKCLHKKIYAWQKANPPSPISMEHKREYMRKYIMRRYHKDPAFRRKMIDSSRRYQQRRRKEAKEAVACLQ